MSNDLIASLEILYQDAKASVCTVDTKSQRQQLALTYVKSLVRRMDARLMMIEEARDEIAIALVGRARPVVFWIGEEKSTGSKVVPVTPSPSIASVKLAGKHQTVHTLQGEIKSFGTPAASHVACISQKAGATPMVEEPGCY